MYGKLLKDEIAIYCIREINGAERIRKVMRSKILSWYAHVKRMSTDITPATARKLFMEKF